MVETWTSEDLCYEILGLIKTFCLSWPPVMLFWWGRWDATSLLPVQTGAAMRSGDAGVQARQKPVLGFIDTLVQFRLFSHIQELSSQIILPKFPKDPPFYPSQSSFCPPLAYSWSLPHNWPGHSTLQESPLSSSVPRGYITPGPPAPTKTSYPWYLAVLRVFQTITE